MCLLAFFVRSVETVGQESSGLGSFCECQFVYSEFHQGSVRKDETELLSSAIPACSKN